MENERIEILEKLEFEKDEIQDEIRTFEVVEEFENKVIIESELGIEYEVTISKMTNQLQIKELF